jgi:negative regulator of flagellin synthesis FlgM
MINGISSSIGGGLGGIGQTSTQKGEAVQRAKPGVAQEDRAAVTTTIGQIAAGGAPIDSDRVSALRAAIRAGTYRADPQAIAQKMISSDLGTSL